MKSTQFAISTLGLSFVLAASLLTANPVLARDVSTVLGRGAPVIIQGSTTLVARVEAPGRVAAVERIAGRSPVTHITQVRQASPRLATKHGARVSEVQGRAGTGA